MSKNNPVGTFFASVKLAIVLLALISAASILGTLIPQQESAGPFINRLSPGVIDVMRGLHLFDIFHSAWFIILLTLLALNLVACSLYRFPLAWKLFRQKSEPDRDNLFEIIPPDRVVIKETSLSEETDRLEKLLGKKGRVGRRDMDNRSYLHVEKGAYSYFGVYVVHLSILVMMAGIIIGSFWGFEGYMNIPEGESSAIVALKRGRGVKNLDFAIQCDRFFIDFYENGTPKTYRSDLTFLKAGSRVQSSSVLVNYPASFAGIRFYQANYGMTPTGDPVVIVMRNDRKIKDVKVAIGMEFDLPEKKAKARMIRVEEDLMGMGPAVKLSIQSPAGHIHLWVFQAIEQIMQANPGLIEQVPLFNPGLFEPYVFSLGQTGSRYYTGLQVTRDPGVPVVAAGAALMMIGLIIVFFGSHRQIWIRLDKEGDKTRISITGKSNRDAVGLNREIRKRLDAIMLNRESAT
ncbi:MAG: cytochrome c biogenesis protein ResB [Pseudomonadota bacterium]